MKKPFAFKQFVVHQDRCAMKIGTDGVLLGAWVSLQHDPHTVLDIGTGTGLIALMLAQRSHAHTIDAVELDARAYEQSMENFEASPWSDRLFCYHASLQEFANEIPESYDLVITNPPYYAEPVSSTNTARDNARHTQSLSFIDLLEATVQVLSKQGQFAVVIPFKEEEAFVQLAGKYGLFAQRITRVRGHIRSKVKRSLLQFSFAPGIAETQELIIEHHRHQYSSEYRELTQAFYLKM